MRLRQSVAGWLLLVLCTVAGISTALALSLHERGLRIDLRRVTQEHLLQAAAMTEHLLDQHLRGGLRRYRASAQTPELRTNLELTHTPSLTYYAQILAKQHGALGLAFLRSGKQLASAGDATLSDVALARLSQLSTSAGACAAANGVVCADAPEEGMAFALTHSGQLFAVTLVSLGSGSGSQDRLFAVEEIGPAILAEWSSLMLARVSVSTGDPLAEGVWQPVRELGGGTLRVEVSGDAERRALVNARSNLMAAGEIVLLLALAASLLLARALVRPIQRIGEASRRIQAGDLGVRLRSGRRDEIGEVARAFDAMLDRVQGALEGLARAQQLAELGSWTLELSSGAVDCSHELRRICDLDAGTGLDLAQLLERCVHPEDRPRVREAIERCIRNGEPVRLDHRTLPLGGAPRVVHTQAERIPQGGDPERIEGTLQDVTERRLIEEQLRYLAEHDGLTGLGNRRLLEEQLSVMLSEARLQPRGLAVLVLGLDDFKMINDTLGPSWGDRALEQVAQRLAQVATPHLALARIGGDEFAVLAGDISDASGAARIARRMLRVLRAPLVLDGHELVVGASVGIALWPNDGVDPESLLRSAGAALHVAKQHGRACHQFYDESLNAPAFKRLALEKGLRRALENGEFELHYQPVLDLASRRVVGVEALLRWRDPENGLIPPAGFIPIAEETGLIRELGIWILRTAVAQIRSWKGTPLAGLSVAINVSAAQLDGLELASHLEQALAEAGIEPSSLMLEITESLLPSDPVAASALLERIAALGVRIALDDFGIGFSSLSALRQLPVHTVKLDRSFASSLGTDPRSTQLMGAIVAMAHVLSLSVTVEGIETEDQLEIVREFGCDAIQGYLVSAAVEASDLPRVVVEIEGEDEKRLTSEPSA